MGTFGNILDAIGTAINAPDLGWSEAASGNKATTNTGRVGFTDTGGWLNTASSPAATTVNNAFSTNLSSGTGRAGDSAAQYTINANKIVPAITSDPYAQYGGAAAYNTLRSGFDNQKNNIFSTSLDAANSLAGGYNQNVLDTIHSLTQSQQGVDKQRVDNEAAKTAGTRDILDMVGRGIRSGGVTLAGRNAGNSSAAQAIAGAYGELGRGQLSKVGNQYEKAAGDIDLTQQDLAYQIAQAPEKFRLGLMQNVDNIVATARDKLSQLDASMASASLPDRIAIDQERQNIKNQVLGVLDQYNGKLSQGLQGIQGAGMDDIRGRANSQLAAGQAPANAFNYTTDTPTALQGTGPFASELPIFTYRNRTDT